MAKICIRILWRLWRPIIHMENLSYQCIKMHRIRIVQILHPISASILLLTTIFFFVYELYYVLPECSDVTGIWYKIHWLFGLYLIHNIVGNMLMCWLTDTTFIGLPQEQMDPLSEEAHLWHLCTHCQMMVPPRAWHCRLCNCCILKRDHHCNVTANCIGYANQRYFVSLLLHLTIGCLISFGYNLYHLFSQGKHIFNDRVSPHSTSFSFNLSTDERLDPKITWLIINGAILKINLCAMALAASHLVVQVITIIRGSSLNSIYDRSYDLGYRRNVQSVLGKRMLWAVMSPLVSSPLPHDGTKFQLALDQDHSNPA